MEEQWPEPCFVQSCTRRPFWTVTDSTEVRHYCSKHALAAHEDEPDRWRDDHAERRAMYERNGHPVSVNK